MDNVIFPKIHHDPVKLLGELKSKPEDYWIKKGEKRALQLFHLMAERVPAYKDFLKKNKISHELIHSINDFKKIPTLNKDNYLRLYPRASLCWDGNLKNNRWTISTTSGSTGEPYYFPRQIYQDLQYALIAELYLLTNYSIDRKSTLYICAFPMGGWIGGVFTYEAIRILAERGKYPLSIITPGINKTEVLKAVKNLGQDFDQIIIGSYAPFLKDILDDGINMGIDWKKYNPGFIFSAEGFSESFRDYVIKNSGIKDIYRGTLNHYGTVDLGTMSYETPVSIMIRRLAVENKNLYKYLFLDNIKLPTLTQYNPEMFYFEENQGALICSSFSGLPLVRYDLKDHGGIISFKDMKARFTDAGLNLGSQINKNKLGDTIWNLPFVYIYERGDFSVSFYAFQIYPATIRRALQINELEDKITGKFTMAVDYDKDGQQIFSINIELKSNVTKSLSLERTLAQLIKKQLLKESSEYKETTEKYGEKTTPQIILWRYEDPTYFKPGIKQKWVKN